MTEQRTSCARLQAALEAIDESIGSPDATCSILGSRRDEALLVGTADGYLVLARTALAIALKAVCGSGPAEVVVADLPEIAERPLVSGDIGEALAGMGPYRQLVIPVTAYLAADEEGRRRIERMFEELGE